MDRWSDRDRADDDDVGRSGAAARPMGQVARAGLGAFVKSNQGITSSETTAFQPATVTASRREQAQTQQAVATAARLTASGAQRPAPAQPQAAASAFTAPSWAVEPPQGAELQCLKNGALVQTVALRQRATLFGRLASADVQLEHASISRQHAVLCFREDGQAVLMDLDSAHGTFLGGQRLPKHLPRDVAPGEQLRFGASTRTYSLQRRAVSSSGAQQVGNKRRSVSWPDEDAAGPDEKRHSSGSRLEQIIGYSDGHAFAVNVGPVAAEPDEGSKGRFAGLASHVVRPSPAKAEPPSGEAGVAAGADDAGQEDSRSHASKVKRLAQEEFRKFVESGRRKSSSFYDELPPPAAGS